MHSAGHDSESHAKHSEFISGTLNHHLEACYHGNEIYIYCYQDLKSHYVKSTAFFSYTTGSWSVFRNWSRPYCGWNVFFFLKTCSTCTYVYTLTNSPLCHIRACIRILHSLHTIRFRSWGWEGARTGGWCRSCKRNNEKWYYKLHHNHSLPASLYPSCTYVYYTI